MALSLVVDSKTQITSGTPDWQGRASIKRRPSDNALVMVYRVGADHFTDTDAAVWIKFSDDDGATWTDPNVTLGGGAVTGFPMNPPAPGTVSYGDAWLYVAPNDTLILHMWSIDGDSATGTLLGTYQSVSVDGGESWSVPAQVTLGIPGVSDDRVFVTDDNFELAGVIYGGARVYNTIPTTESYVIFVKSEDNGATWAHVSDVTGTGSETQEIGFEYLGDNNILGFIRSLNNDVTLQATSADLGATWTITDVTSEFGPTGRHRLYTFAHLRGEANWWTDPNLILTGFQLVSPGISQGRRPAVWLSDDAGANWATFLLDGVYEDAGYGDLFYGSDFGVVSYLGTLLAAQMFQYDLTVTDSGPTFCEFSSAFSNAFALCVAPVAPTNPAAAALSSSSIRITWDNVANETGYRVERSPNGTTGWADVSGNLAADTIQYDDTGLTASTQYFYRVIAFNAIGDSDPSATVNAITSAGPTPPPTPSGNRIGGSGAIRRPPRRTGR